MAPEQQRLWNFSVSYDHTRFNEGAFNILLPYMSVQKLRTPKGLADLAEKSKIDNPNHALILLQEY